jgi:hypothetical protein
MYYFYKNSTILSFYEESNFNKGRKKGKQMKNHLLAFLISQNDGSILHISSCPIQIGIKNSNQD